MRRLIAAILAIPTVLNGLAMLAAGRRWYGTVPGASDTGPFAIVLPSAAALYSAFPNQGELHA